MRRRIIYKVIYNDILRKIKSGELSPGDKIPTEKELKLFYKSSVSPVRKSLGILENQGFIKRVPGQGTRVAYFNTFSKFDRSGFSEYYTLHANNMVLKNLSIETVKSDEETSNFFDLEVGSKLLKISKLRTVNDIPVALKFTYIPFSFVNNDVKDGFDELTFNAVRKSILVNEKKAYESLAAVMPPEHVSKHLKTKKHTPVLYVTRHSLDGEGNPVEFARYWARTDIMKYNAYLSE